MTEPTPIKIITADHTQLGAMRFEPSGTSRAEILVGGATAVPQGFYQRFAKHANQAGFAVTTVDYRGIGASAPKTLKKFRMNYLDWGRQDLAAALTHIHEHHAENKPIYMVGHSYGGHGFGLMHNHALIKKHYSFAVGAGWSGYMPLAERLKVEFLWKVLGPVLTPIAGYMPGRFVGGENLPIDVYRQWRHWCGSPNYFFDDASVADALKHFADVRTPICATNADDDLWATPKSRDAFFKGYTGAPLTLNTIRGADYKSAGGKPGIGHMGYFRRGSERLWDDALAWFESNPNLDAKSR
jgi:predicted alpha/beta hydrolase